MRHASQREPQHGRIDVLAVHDHPEKRKPRFERGGDRTRVAASKRAHGIEQVREPRQPFRQRRLGLVIACHGMPERDADARFCELGDEAGRHAFRGERHERHPGSRRCQQLDIFRAWLSDQRAIVNAGLRGRQEWAFEVDAQNAWVRGGGLICSLKSGAHFFRGVGDQRRQQRRGPELPVSSSDLRHRSGAWIVIQEDIAAAIHLNVDETGR